MIESLRNLYENDEGQDFVEYTLLLAFMALASAALYITSGGAVCRIWDSAISSLHKGGG